MGVVCSLFAMYIPHSMYSIYCQCFQIKLTMCTNVNCTYVHIYVHMNKYVFLHFFLQFGKGGGGKKKPPGKLNKEIDLETSMEMAKVEQLSADEVDVKLMKMLDEMNVTNEAARQDILGRPIADKQNMLKNFLLREAATTKHEHSKPEDFIRELSQDISSKDHLFQMADKLRISLTNNGLGCVLDTHTRAHTHARTHTHTPCVMLIHW